MRVLVVESDAGMAEALVRSLRRKGHSVHVARDGIEGLYHGSMVHHDAVILSERLPERSGFEVLWELRRRGVNSRILMMVEPGSTDDHVAALEYGADAYISKPVDADHVVERLQALSARRRLFGRRSKLKVGSLRIDRRGQRVWRAGEPVRLTAEEYLLLELLASNAGRVVDASEIADRLGNEALKSPRLIEAYVRRLQRKLERPGVSPLIRILDGARYALSLEPAA